MSWKQFIPPRVKELIRTCITMTIRSGPIRAANIFKLRLMVARAKNPVCLHLGCGPRHLPGWINIDLFPTIPMPDVLLDVEHPLMLKEGSVDYIFTEDLIEHLSLAGAKSLVRECARVLKPGGVLRIGTPDLQSFIRAYLDQSQGDLAFYKDCCGVETFAEMFNAGMRAWGHTFIYDEETLSRILKSNGLTTTRKGFNETDSDVLRGLDLRDTADGAHSMFLECTKPSPSRILQHV